MVSSLAGYGTWETWRHRRALERIPIRIHVNGTRGKSSVTRLIAAGLRGGGRRTFAKTTGTMARMIFPDGREADVYRVGRPNIIEQIRVVRRAIECRAEAMVIECMAVTPELQPISELQLIRSTVGVITNARADHLDLMGPTVDDVAMTLAQTSPRRGDLFTSERRRAHLLERVATARGSRLHVVDPHDVAPGDLAGFSYLEHAENLALALAVCQHLGVPRDVALESMKQAAADPGVLRHYQFRAGARTLTFVNAFAANDPDSTELIWKRLGLDRTRPGVRRVVLASCRDDRVQRSGQIAEFVARRVYADHVVLTGQGTELVLRQALEHGLARDRITDLGGRPAAEVCERVPDLAGDGAVIIGIGNIVGLGDEIDSHFRGQAVAGG